MQVNGPGSSITWWNARNLKEPWNMVCTSAATNRVAVDKTGTLWMMDAPDRELTMKLQQQGIQVQKPGLWHPSAKAIIASNNAVAVIGPDSVHVYKAGSAQYQYSIPLGNDKINTYMPAFFSGSQADVLFRQPKGMQYYSKQGKLTRWTMADTAQGGVAIYAVCEGEQGMMYLSHFGEGIILEGPQYMQRFAVQGKPLRISWNNRQLYCITPQRQYVLSLHELHRPIAELQTMDNIHLVACKNDGPPVFAQLNTFMAHAGRTWRQKDKWFSDFSDLVFDAETAYVSSYSHGVMRQVTPGRFEPFVPQQLKLPGAVERMKLQNRQLYLLTQGSGLYRVNLANGTGEGYSTATGLASNAVFGVWPEADTLWIATEGALNIVSHGKTSVVGNDKGLIGRRALAAFRDASRRLWVLSEEYLHLYHEGRLVAIRSHPLKLEDGWTLEMARYQPEQDVLWLGVQNALLAVHMNKVWPSYAATATFLYNVQHGNQPIDFRQQNIKLPYRHLPLSVSFARPHYALPASKVVYYKLSGFHQSFQILGDDNQVVFPKLPPGTYTLQVKTEGPDFGQTPLAALLTITVAKPFWQQWWFVTLVAAFITSLAIYFTRRRIRHAYQLQLQQTRQQYEMQLERSRISRELHDNVGSMLTLMINKMEDEVPSEGQQHQVKDLARHTLGQLRQAIWALDSQSITLAEWQNRANDYLQSLKAAGCSIQVQWQWPHNGFTMSPVKALHAFRILQEACTNVVKHSQQSSIQITGKLTGHQLHLCIKDDGSGFDVARNQVGYGLRNMHKRADEMGGSLAITSRPGAGTSVQLSWPSS
jgi:signal transduction histidine kinase